MASGLDVQPHVHSAAAADHRWLSAGAAARCAEDPD
eukprot:SAG11_NODE_11690_length_744_cov_0.880620_2_plen_35_part_01